MRYAIRTLFKAPGFSAIAIATIALGIAANTAIFSVVNGVLLRPLPFPDEARVVKVSTSTPSERESNFSAGEYMDLRQARMLKSLAGYREDVAAVAVNGQPPSSLTGAWVTPEFFDVLGTPPVLGRLFTGADGPAGGRKLVVLGYQPWQRLFGGDAGAAGKAIRINGEVYTIAAVMPAEFAWPLGARMWMLSPRAIPPAPIALKDPDTNRDVQYFQAVARVAPDVTVARAQEELHALAPRNRSREASASSARDFIAVPIRERIVGDVRPALLVLQGAVGLVLLIACANVSSLLIARATGRRRELAIRAALGAERKHLIRQMLSESLVLGVTGGAAGLLLSGWLVVLLRRIVPASVPRASDISVDGSVALVTLIASLAAGLLFGLLPAIQASRARAANVIKEGGERGSTRARGRAGLVVAEIALTLILLVGAGLLANSFVRLQRVDPGFRPDHVMVANLLLPQSRYRDAARQIGVYQRLIDSLAAQSGVEAAGIGFPAPFRGANAGGNFTIEGRTPPAAAEQPYAHLGIVSSGYFAAMGIPLLSGRTFAETDSHDAPPVAIATVALARKYWPGENPIGKRIQFSDNPKDPWVTIVGLSGDVKQLGLNAAAPPILFFPYQQFTLPFTTAVVRSALPDAVVASMMRAQLAQIDPDLPFADVLPLQTSVERDVAEPRFRAILITVFAGMALLLAAVGVYGLISYTVAQRTREIGIRVALGAAPRQVLLPVVREGLVLALTGIALGLAGAFAVARALSDFLFGVGAADPLTFASVALLLLGVALVASYVPSRRALNVDPIVALRAE